MKGDQSKVDRRYTHIDLAPREIEARYRYWCEKLRTTWRVDPWAQRPGYEGATEYAPSPDELPSYRDTEQARAACGRARTVWTKRKDRT